MRYVRIALLVFGWILFAGGVTAGVNHAQQQTPPAATETRTPEEAAAQQVIQTSSDAAANIEAAITRFLNELQQVPQSELVRAILLIGGVVLLLIGWRIYNFIIILAGTLIGSLVAVSLVGSSGTLITVAALLVGAVIGAALGAIGYYVAVALIGAYVGILLTAQGAIVLELTPVSPWVVLIGAAVGAVILVLLSFELLVLLSSIVGAQMITLALGLDPLWTFALLVVGVILQAWLSRASGYKIRRSPTRRTLLSRD